MEDKPRNDIKDLIVDPEKFISEISEQKVRLLLMELDMLIEDYERENAIMYLASNYSVNKHLSFSALRGMHDYEIKEIMATTRETIVADLKSRKKN